MSPVQTVELSVSKGGVVLVKIIRADGSIRADDLSGNPTIKTVRRAARNLNIPEDAIWKALSQFPDTATAPIQYPYADLVTPVTAPVVYSVRDLTSNLAASFASFDDALAAATSPDAVIEWVDVETCCAVDLDYHGEQVPNDLENRVRGVQPQPRFWWWTKSGSIRLIYFAGEQWSARDLAVVATVQLVKDDNRATVELLTRTRRPAQGSWFECQPTYSCDALHAVTGAPINGDDDWSQWLEDKGYAIGGRYPHTACPVNPYEAATGNPGNALVVHERYIKCYICERDGTRRGGSDAGYFPLSALAGDPIPSRLRVCVQQFTHWTHARLVMLQDLPAMPESLAEHVYRALLKMRHGRTDPRIPFAFHADQPNGLVRMHGYWADSYGTAYKLNPQSPMLAKLPCTLDRELVSDRAKVELLAQVVDLSPNGYPALAPIWGCRITRNQTLPTHRVFTVLQPKDLRPADMAPKRARYLPPSSRSLDESGAWSVLERAFPRCNRNAIKLLVAAKGCSEMKSGLPPMVFFTGPTGAGKTTTALLAAAICGDAVRKVPYVADRERLFAALRSVKDAGSFASFDEFLKGAVQAQRDPESAMSLVLELNEDAVTHLLYVGPVALGDLPVLVWTDTEIPDKVKTHAQIGRRMHHVYLGSSMDWETSMRETDIREPHLLRVRGDAEYVHAANVILSTVIDEYFPAGTTTDFHRVADALGFKRLFDCDLAREWHGLVRQLFAAVCDKTGGVMAMPDDLRVLCSGEGWVHINLDLQGDASTLYGSLADKRDPAICRVIDESDLQLLLGLRVPARCERRAVGRKLAIRFVSNDGSIFNGGLR